MNNEKKRDGGLIGRGRKRVGERGFVGWKRGKWLEGTAEAQAELDPRLRGRARAEPGLLREEPGLEARGGNEGRRGAENRRRLWQSWGRGRGQSQGPQL